MRYSIVIGDRTVVVVRNDGQIVRVIERGFLDLGFCGEVDRESMSDGQPSERYNTCSSKSEIEADVCYSRRPENCSERHSALPEHYQERVHSSAHPSGHHALSGHPKLGSCQRPSNASKSRRDHQSGHLADERHREDHGDHQPRRSHVLGRDEDARQHACQP